MNKRPDVFKPITNEQLRALSEKNGWVGKERGVEPEEVGITAEIMREAQVSSGRPPRNGPQKLEALRAVIGGTTDAQVRASMEALRGQEQC